MKAVPPPNYTQIPNEFLDRMDEFTPAEFKVLMALCRETFGWHRKDTTITLGQLVKLTGLTRSTVSLALGALEGRKRLERITTGVLGKQTVSTRLCVDADPSDNPTSLVNGLVGLSDQSDNQAETSLIIGRGVVRLLDPPPLKKDLKKLKENDPDPGKENGHRNGTEPAAETNGNGTNDREETMDEVRARVFIEYGLDRLKKK